MNYEADFSIINVLVDNFKKDIQNDDIEVYVFPQVWGSTALGYGGIGGSAMTSSSTIVLHAFYTNIVRVYFGGEKLAYEIHNPAQIFWDDLYKHNVADCHKASKYIRIG